MPFDIIDRTGQGMRQVVGFGDRSTVRDTLGGGNLGRAIVTSGDFTAYVCDNTLTVGSAVGGGASGGPRDNAVLDGGPRRARRRGSFGGSFSLF